MLLIGEVAGSDVILLDDMVDTAGTLLAAARTLKEAGARRVYGFISHGVFSDPGTERLAAAGVLHGSGSLLEELIVSDYYHIWTSLSHARCGDEYCALMCALFNQVSDTLLPPEETRRKLLTPGWLSYVSVAPLLAQALRGALPPPRACLVFPRGGGGK